MKTISFKDWLAKQLKDQGWSQADLAKKAGISRGTVTNLLSGNRQPGPDACTAIAYAFKISPTTVFRKAGLLPPTAQDEYIEKIMHNVSQMTEDEKEELFQYILMKRKIREERKVRQNKNE